MFVFPDYFFPISLSFFLMGFKKISFYADGIFYADRINVAIMPKNSLYNNSVCEA